MILRRNAAPELTALRYQVVGIAMEIHSALGPMLRESHYQRCFAHALAKRGLRLEQHVAMDLHYDGLVLHRALEMDLVVEGQLVVELKAAEPRIPLWDAQVLSYLEHSGLPVGVLLNFRVPHLREGIRPYVNLPTEDGIRVAIPEREVAPDVAGEDPRTSPPLPSSQS